MSRKHHCGFEKHPAADFIHVAMRYLCFGVSTATAEQSFSALKRLLGEQGLHASDAAEEQTARVLLSPGSCAVRASPVPAGPGADPA